MKKTQRQYLIKNKIHAELISKLARSYGEEFGDKIWFNWFATFNRRIDGSKKAHQKRFILDLPIFYNYGHE